MLSVASVKSASGAATYFAKDDYYTGEHASEASAWGGAGAAELGLKGEVQKAPFEAILNGVQPSGDSVGQVQNRQSGVDLTFSMPKSASVMAYVAGDARVLAAHMTAVKATMGWVEKRFAEGRSYERIKGGEPVVTGKLVYALFQHDTSRALDPQGHIHAVIANMTRMANGAWQALHNGALWRNNSVIGAAYHAQFRTELEKLGYRTEITGKHGQFEIQGVPAAVLKEFSQRRADILEKAAALGLKSTEALREVTKRTRDPKLNVEDRQALRASWTERAAALGFDGKSLVTESIARAGGSSADQRPAGATRLREAIADVATTLGRLFRSRDPLVDNGLERLRLSPVEARAQHAVASAIRILGEREAASSTSDLTRAALSLGLKGVTAEPVEARVAQLIRTERLVPGTSDRIDGLVTLVTTPDALAAETRILDAIARGRNAVAPIAPASGVTERLQAAAGATPLNPGQLAAATLALASTDRTVAVQGVAGAGKSTMIAAVARVAEAEGRTVLGLAFQNKMVGDLRDGAGIAAQTVSSFVNAYARHALRGEGEGFDAARARLNNTVLVLDEASMVANDPMRNLLAITNALGLDRLVMVGDRQQLSAIDAGKSFALAQAGGISTARMDENLRQRTDLLRTVAALANIGEARAALEVLGERVFETRDHVAAAASQWLGLPAAERDATLVLASGRVARAELNERIQQGLKADGTLHGEGHSVSTLERVNLTREELRHGQSYRPGQLLEVARALPELNLPRGVWEVKGIDRAGRVELQVGSRSRLFDPQRIAPDDRRDALALVERQEVTLHEGDRIRWTRNDKVRDLDNAALARVLAVGRDAITVETAKGSVVELRHGDPMLERIGLAYALNMHMAQGVTADRGIAVMASNERQLSNQRLFNVTVSRVRDDLTLFVDDKAALAGQLERNPGNKTSALETIGRLEVDRPPPSAPAAGRSGATFNPSLPPELVQPARAEGSLRVGAGPKENAIPLPEKGLELGL